MRTRFTPEQDPADWCAVFAVFFLALVWWHLGIPSRIYFDEVHYVTAARKLIEGGRFNPEHPMLGKEVIAAAISVLGDKPLWWRAPSAVLGAFGLFAFARLMWFATGRRGVTFIAMFLLATDFSWFIQSRIAMLDMVMASLGMLGLWQFTAAIRLPHQARWRLALAGLALGLALGAKWSIATVAMLPGLALLWGKLRDAALHGGRWRGVLAREGGLIPGVSLPEAALWLGLLPLLIYWLTYWPGFLWAQNAINPWDPLGWHRYMLELQDSVKRLHPYRSVWYQWIFNWRAIWYLYEQVDGAQRGILLIGNPFTMLAGLPALLWCLWAGFMRSRRDALGFAALYLAALGLWIVSTKPIQFYYHYLLPAAFLMAVLALALEALWNRLDDWRWLTPAALTMAAAMFLWFYPIISAAPLHHGKKSYADWMWLDSWR